MCTACDWAPHFAGFGTAGGGSRPSGSADVRPRSAPGDRAADVVFHSGRVYTGGGPAPWAQAVAVAGNAIVYVGDDAGAMALAGDGILRICGTPAQLPAGSVLCC
jgi:hypothetical protein